MVWLPIGKQHMFSCIINHFTVQLHIFCNHICLQQELHTTRNSTCGLVQWVVRSSTRVPECRVHAAADMVFGPNWQFSSSPALEFLLILITADWGQHTL
jgi:hypothetical protein